MKSHFWILMGALISVCVALAATPPKNRIPYKEALTTAQKKCKGKASSTGLEERDGQWIYTFEIHTTDQKTCWIEVNAMTGELIKW